MAIAATMTREHNMNSGMLIWTPDYQHGEFWQKQIFIFW